MYKLAPPNHVCQCKKMKQGKVKNFKLKIYNSEEDKKRNEGQEHSNSVINLIPLMRRITVANTKITTLRTRHTGITPKEREGERGANHPQIRSASRFRSTATSSEQSILPGKERASLEEGRGSHEAVRAGWSATARGRAGAAWVAPAGRRRGPHCRAGTGGGRTLSRRWPGPRRPRPPRTPAAAGAA